MVRVLEPVQELVDELRYRYVDIALHIVPVNGEAEVFGTHPVEGDAIELNEGVV